MLLLFASAVAAQSGFDSASVKPSELGIKMEGMGRVDVTPGSVTMLGASLRAAVAWSYAVREDQVSGPDWIGVTRFDFIGKAANAVPVADLRKMMQALLADRFALALHRENKERQVFAITVGPDGPKLTPATEPGSPKLKVSDGVLVFQHYTLPELADRLSGGAFGLSRPVLDRTGIAGAYDLSVQTGANTKEMKMAAERTAQGNELPDFSPYVAAFREAGLKLESRKEPMENLVIDHAEKSPKAN
jgi:uncharacterized protein (TIGR03435 family)